MPKRIEVWVCTQCSVTYFYPLGEGPTDVDSGEPLIADEKDCCRVCHYVSVEYWGTLDDVLTNTRR